MKVDVFSRPIGIGGDNIGRCALEYDKAPISRDRCVGRVSVQTLAIHAILDHQLRLTSVGVAHIDVDPVVVRDGIAASVCRNQIGGERLEDDD